VFLDLYGVHFAEEKRKKVTTTVSYLCLQTLDFGISVKKY